MFLEPNTSDRRMNYATTSTILRASIMLKLLYPNRSSFGSKLHKTRSFLKNVYPLFHEYHVRPRSEDFVLLTAPRDGEEILAHIQYIFVMVDVVFFSCTIDACSKVPVFLTHPYPTTRHRSCNRPPSPICFLSRAPSHPSP